MIKKFIGVFLVLFLVLPALLFAQTRVGQRLRMLKTGSADSYAVHIDNIYTRFNVSFYVKKNVDDIYDISAFGTGLGSEYLTTTIRSGEFYRFILRYLYKAADADNEQEWKTYYQEISLAIGRYDQN
jgi:hypothetical protein